MNTNMVIRYDVTLPGAIRIAVAVAVALASTLGLSRLGHAQSDCKYQDERGNCSSTPIFTEKPKNQQKQQIRIASRPRDALVSLIPVAELASDEADDLRREPILLGQTPVIWNRRVEPGKYRIRFAADGYETREIEAYISKGGKQWFSTRLSRKPWLTIKSVEDGDDASLPLAGATVFIDGVEQAQKTPFRKQLDSGRHQIEVSQDGYDSYKTALTLSRGGRHDITAILTPERGTLSLRSDLINVPVVVSQGHCGDAAGSEADSPSDVDFPTTIDENGVAVANLPKGKYCVTLQVTGLSKIRRSVTVDSSQRTSHEFTLLPQLIPNWYQISVPHRTAPELTDMAKRCRSSRRRKRPSDTDCFDLGVQIFQSTRKSKFIVPLYRALCKRGHYKSCEVYGFFAYTEGAPGTCLDAGDEHPGCRAYHKACYHKRLSACYRIHTPHDAEQKRNPLLEYEIREEAPRAVTTPARLKRIGNSLFLLRGALAPATLGDKTAWDVRMAAALSLAGLRWGKMSFHVGPYLEGGFMQSRIYVADSIGGDRLPVGDTLLPGWSVSAGLTTTTTWLGDGRLFGIRLSNLSMRIWGGGEFSQILHEDVVQMIGGKYGTPFRMTGGAAVTLTLTRRAFFELALAGHRRPTRLESQAGEMVPQGEKYQLSTALSIGMWSN